MNLARLKPGDTVEVNVRGRRFEASFVGPAEDGGARIEPPKGISHYYVTSQQIKKRLRRG